MEKPCESSLEDLKNQIRDSQGLFPSNDFGGKNETQNAEHKDESV